MARVSNVACFLLLAFRIRTIMNVTVKIISKICGGKKERQKLCVVKQTRRFHMKDFLYIGDVSEVTLPLRWDTAIYLFSLAYI